MIPPVYIRQIRSCEECVFYNTLEEFCTLHEETLFPEKIERWEYDDQTVPCRYHFTPDEMMEFIEGEPYNGHHNGVNGKIWMAQ
ncbi:hypothetical protein DSECCO2_62670 [anaerobic digester metagenome]